MTKMKNNDIKQLVTIAQQLLRNLLSPYITTQGDTKIQAGRDSHE
jgi:hypothetical protein